MPGPKSDKLWADAVRVAVNDHVDGDPKKPKALRQLAANLVKLALDGDMQAVKEIGDRLDGKPAQTTLHQGDDDKPVTIKVRIGGD